MKVKKTALFIIFIAIFAVFASVRFSVASETAYAYSTEDISVTFKNHSEEIVPEKTAEGYYIEYIADMKITVYGSILSDPAAKSSTDIRQDGKSVNAIYRAGIYEITLIVEPSSGEGWIPKAFILEVKKKEIKDINFAFDSVNVTYLDELSPKILLDSEIEKNTKVSYAYYSDESLSNEIAPPENAGEYWIKAKVEGDNYFGEGKSKLTISKNNASISYVNRYPEITYVSDTAGENGYCILDLLGASVTNTDNPIKHKLKTYILFGEEYIEQEYIKFPNNYEYKLFFENGDNYSASPITGSIVLKKADTEIVFGEEIFFVFSNDKVVEESAKALLNKENGICVNSVETQTAVKEINPSQLLFYFFDSEGNEIENPPKDVGSYRIKAEFSGNDYYNSSVSQIIGFEIVKRDISNEIIVMSEKNYGYGEAYDVENSFTIPNEYSLTPEYRYKEIDEDYNVLQVLNEKPSLPGRYVAELSVENNNVYGLKKFVFTISKLPIPENAISANNLNYVYGEALHVQVYVNGEYNVSEENIVLTFADSNGVKLDGIPKDVGDYILCICIENEIYQGEFERELNISKKDLILSVKDVSVTYGNPLFSYDENGAYKADYFTVDGLVYEEDLSFVLSSITVFVGENEYTTNNMNLVVGAYGMKLSGEHKNYNILDGGSGILTVTKRTLTVRTSTVKQYVGFSYSPIITVENSVYNDIAENMVYLFEIAYFTEDGVALNTLPALDGLYKIRAKVKAENIDCAELKNYTLNVVESTLTLLSNKKADSENQIILEGKFDINAELTVKSITANEAVENAIKAVDKNYDIEKLYFIQYTFNTVDGSKFILKLNRAGIDLENAKIMIAYNTEEFQEADYTVQGDYIVLKLENMASYYAICTPHKLPLVWIIVIVVAVVLVLGGIGVFLWIYFTGANVKARKNGATLSSAVTASQGVKTEDEEFDELLESFDESTVEKHEDPAKRISRQAVEAEREQYRLYLRRMRASTDKNALDKMQELGLNSDVDEEKLIDQLIEDDRKKRLIAEKEKALKKAEAERKKQEETSYKINERKGGTLSGASMPVSPNKKGVDDDIDF